MSTTGRVYPPGMANRQMLDLLERQQHTGFRDLAGSEVTATIHLSAVRLAELLPAVPVRLTSLRFSYGGPPKPWRRRKADTGQRPLVLSAHEFRRRLTAARRSKAAYVLAGDSCRVFQRVGAFDSITNAFARDSDCTDAHVSFPDLDRAQRVIQKGSVPSIRLQRPRTNKHAALDHDRPDADESMVGPAARADAENLARVDGRYELMAEGRAPFVGRPANVVWSVSSSGSALLPSACSSRSRDDYGPFHEASATVN